MNPTPQHRKLFKSVIEFFIKPEIEITAPICVTSNHKIIDNDTETLFLHNNPGSIYRYPVPQKSNYLHTPGEVLPIYDIKINFKYDIKNVKSGITNFIYKLEDNSIIIDKLNLYEV